MNVDLSKIDAQIAKLSLEIEALEDQGQRLFPSRRAQVEAGKLVSRIADLTPAEVDEFLEVCEQATLAGKVDQIYRLRETCDAQLMKIDTRYVVTDQDLVSPAGFSFEDRVFLQTPIAFHTDQYPLPHELPVCDAQLKVHDMENLR